MEIHQNVFLFLYDTSLLLQIRTSNSIARAYYGPHLKTSFATPRRTEAFCRLDQSQKVVELMKIQKMKRWTTRKKHPSGYVRTKSQMSRVCCNRQNRIVQGRRLWPCSQLTTFLLFDAGLVDRLQPDAPVALTEPLHSLLVVRIVTLVAIRLLTGRSGKKEGLTK